MRIQPVWLVAIFSLLSAASQAQFMFTTNNGAITITAYVGSGGAVVIPNATNGWPVTSIGPAAFDNYNYNMKITSITVPNSITNIGNSAFEDCTALTNINIPGSVISLGQYVCASCENLESVTLGNGLTMIGTNMFSDTGLSSVVVPNSVTSIGPSAFGASFLTNIVISANLASLGDSAFYLCYDLRSVYFLGNVPAAGASPFSGDTSVTAYYLPFTTGWTNTFAGIPAALWNPPLPPAGITVYSNQPVVILPYLAESIGTHFQVQMTTNLASGNWVTVTNGVQFIGVQITNAPSPAYFRLQ